MRNRSRSRTQLVVFSVAALLGFGHLLFAKGKKTVVVGTCVAGAYSTIQSAVNAVAPGGTVLVCPGTYPEQVSISQTLTLRGMTSGNSDAAVITAPAAGMTANASFLNSGAPIAAQVAVSAATDVDISHLTVDGSNNGISGCSTPAFLGILYQNSSGTVDRLVVRNQALSGANFACANGLGVYVESGNGGSSEVTVRNSSVHGYQKNGVTASYAGTCVHVWDNTIVGLGPAAQPQNGVQISYGATGDVVGNHVVDNITLSAYTALGILVYASSDVRVVRNKVGSTQTGIGFYSDPTLGDADHGEIEENRVFGTQLYDGIEVCSNDHRVTGNEVTTSNAESGVHLDGSCGSSGNDNRVVENTVDEACAGVLEGTGTSGNTVKDNAIFNATNIVLNGDACPASSSATTSRGATASGTSRRRPSPMRR